MTSNQERWEQELIDGLKKMDKWVEPSTLDVEAWERIIRMERQAQRGKLRRELFIFWMIAVAVMIGVFLSFTQLPVVFILLQIGALLGFPLVWVIKARKKVNIQ